MMDGVAVVDGGMVLPGDMRAETTDQPRVGNGCDLTVDRFVLEINLNWRASVASKTLTGVKMKKSGMFVYLFIYMDVRMSFCTLTLRIFVFAPRSTPSQTSLNRIIRFSNHYPYHLRN